MLTAGFGRGMETFVVGGVTGLIQFAEGSAKFALDVSIYGALGDVLRHTRFGDSILELVPRFSDGVDTVQSGIGLANLIRESRRLIWDGLTEELIRFWTEGRYGEASTGVALDIASLFVGVGAAAKVAKLTQILSVLKRADAINPNEFDNQLDDVLMQLDELGEDPDLVQQAADELGLGDEVAAHLDGLRTSEFPPPSQGLPVPQGLSVRQFDNLSSTVRADIDARGLGDDSFVQSSRSGGTAGPNSDIDIAIRVSPERFREIINDPALTRLSSPNPGSALDRTSTESLVEGRIQTGEARLGNLRDSLEQQFGMDVQISIIREGGPFDNGPQTSLSFNFER